MDGCRHENSPHREWLPVINGVMKLHPHCQSCGTVKNISSDQGKGIGYFTNSLGRLKEYLERKGYRVTQTQIRLIVREFEKRGLSDAYSIPFSHQKAAFVEITRKYIRVSEDVLESFV